MTRKYKNPPINELVIGVYFNPPLFNFRAEHVGLFWSRVKDEYPNVEQQAPLRAIDFTSQGEIFPMPRFWLISKGGEMLMQLQKSAFFFNWRKSREGAYPHFENVKSEFDRFYDVFLAFLSKEVHTPTTTIEACELSYINVIEEGPYWKDGTDTAGVVPSFGMLATGLKNSKAPDFNSVIALHPEDDLSVSITLQTRRDADRNKNVLYFEIKATGSLGRSGTKSEADKWLNRGHDHIVTTFERITSRDIQDKYWSPIS